VRGKKGCHISACQEVEIETHARKGLLPSKIVFTVGKRGVKGRKRSAKEKESSEAASSKE